MSRVNVIADRVVQLSAVCVGSVFLISGVAYLCLGHWTVTHQDFWTIYSTCLNHNWLESALLKHNGHSLFFPSLIWLADLNLFHGNQNLIFYVGLTLLFVTTVLLLLPVWRDNTVDRTGKIMASLVVIVGSFWMGRAHITASGGFDCNASLMMIGAAASFIWLPFMRTGATRFRRATFIVVAGGFLSSFSFGAGLATWPVLLFLAWSLRLPWRCFVLISGAAVIAFVVFALLPPRGATSVNWSAIHMSFLSPIFEFSYFSRMLSAPVFYVLSGQKSGVPPAGLIESSLSALIVGVSALMFAAGEIVYAIVRRDLNGSSFRLIAIALTAFNLIAVGLVVIGRSTYFQTLPAEVAAPRYLFHSSLFWTGALLLAIQHVGATKWLRLPVYTLALIASVLVFPSHYESGLHWVTARAFAEAGATSLINGVRDDERIHIFAPAAGITWVYGLAEQLRSHRLDMFAEGLQDWIGRSELSVFNESRKARQLTGQCRIAGLVLGDDGQSAARVTGVAWTRGKAVPKTLVIVDPNGVICGIARSSAITPLTNRLFYLNRLRTNMGFVGYIRGYKPSLQYTVRTADEGALSKEQILVRPAATPLPLRSSLSGRLSIQTPWNLYGLGLYGYLNSF